MIALAVALACGPKKPPPARPPQPDNSYVTEDGMRITEVRVGTGKTAEPGHAVTVHYSLMLGDGTLVDSSYSRGTPFTFDLGAGQVIAAWDIGVVGMQEGGRRQLMVPPELGYGIRGAGPIPGYATLLFDSGLVEVD